MHSTLDKLAEQWQSEGMADDSDNDKASKIRRSGFQPGYDPRRSNNGTITKQQRAVQITAFIPHYEKAVATLVELLGSARPDVRLRAAERIIARVIGRETERIALTDSDGNDLQPTDAQRQITDLIARLIARGGAGSGDPQPQP